MAAEAPAQRTSLLRNTTLYGVSQSVSLGALFALQVIAGRVLGAEDYGRLSFALAFSLLLYPILDPGLYHLLIREVSKAHERARVLLSRALSWKALMTPVYLALVLGIARLLHENVATLEAVTLFAGAALMQSIKETLRATLIAHEYFGLEAITVGFERFGLLAAVALALALGTGLTGACWAFLGWRTLDAAVAWVLIHRNVGRFGLVREVGPAYAMFRTALPIGAFYITLSIYNYIDMVMLSSLRDDVEVGLYSASYKLYEGPLIVPVILGTVLLPRLSRTWQRAQETFTLLLERGLEYVLLFALGVGLNAIVVAGWLLPFCFGDEYAPAVPAFRILLAGLPFVFLTNFAQTVMISVDRQSVILRWALVGLVLNVAANAVAIPRFGFTGAAAVTVGVEGIVFVALMAHLRAGVAPLAWGATFGLPVLAAAVGGAAAVAVGGAGLWLQLLALNAVLAPTLAWITWRDRRILRAADDGPVPEAAASAAPDAPRPDTGSSTL